MGVVALVVTMFVAWLVIDFVRANWGWKGSHWRLPLVWDLWATASNIHRAHDFALDLLRAHKSDHVTLRLPGIRYTVTTSPADVQHILKDKWKNYVVGTGFRSECVGDMFGAGIFNADGAHWYVQRKHASREFSTHIFRTLMTSEFEAHTQKLIDMLKPKVGTPTIFDLHALMFRLTLDAFGKVAFGLELGGLDDKPLPFTKSFDRAQEILAARFTTKPMFVWKLQRALGHGTEGELKTHLAAINDFVRQLISERRSSAELATKEDLLSKLMSACEADDEVEPAKRDQYLRDMTLNFIIAGRDTTACALSWFFNEVSQRPEVEAKLVAEIDSVFQGRRVAFDDVSQCHYLTACLSETLRLYPSVPSSPKTAVEADTLPCGVVLRPGDTVTYFPYGMGRQTAIWGPDAAEFRPERWLNDDGVFVREDPCKFTAFQAGPRMCLGVDMAMLEMKVVAALLLREFHFNVLNIPQYRTTLVLQMLDGLQVRVLKRSSA